MRSSPLVNQEKDRIKYADGIGRILGNLQALEFVIRVFLYETQSSEKTFYSNLPHLLQKGDITEENALTNYDSLNVLIDKLNSEATRLNVSSEFLLSLETITLRDALIHGRGVQRTPTFPIYLFKFSKPLKGKVTVEYKEEVTLDWLDIHVKLVLREINKVINTAQSLGMETFSGEKEEETK